MIEQLKADHKMEVEMIKKNLLDISEENARLVKQLDGLKAQGATAKAPAPSSAMAASAGSVPTDCGPFGFDRNSFVAKLVSADTAAPLSADQAADAAQQIWNEQAQARLSRGSCRAALTRRRLYLRWRNSSRRWKPASWRRRRRSRS